MNNELTEQKGWWKSYWKWIVAGSAIILLLFTAAFFSSSSGLDNIATDLVQAYADPKLYDDAIKKAQSNPKIISALGQIEPIDKMTILEGEVKFSNNNNTVSSTIRITGTKGKAKMDISAKRGNDKWDYSKINIRIKNPTEKKQTIEVLTEE
ncbi:cytochrome c oxidase assembly factor Coa1 family protein [Zunongwangia sp. F363]|uniref:Cytochrome c oxidase assembly factor Coa1 family protein n=1 Tax=Autumnicola tepida TaxID=3075595 RepID=A0ABU3CEJ2_9FLAO|nr:cytochrome c oxidase assembly factor Coa1 family protein [Zunongwangia sp. F363]MDT0644777.1 cytochrome c oxidase assembly factor Coa1 family protein [Zunongwangia sp. F363]